MSKKQGRGAAVRRIRRVYGLSEADARIVMENGSLGLPVGTPDERAAALVRLRHEREVTLLRRCHGSAQPPMTGAPRCARGPGGSCWTGNVKPLPGTPRRGRFGLMHAWALALSLGG